jgi:hypothetical protein
MRTIQEYVDLVKEKYKADHNHTGISLKECIDVIVDNAFFQDEILYPTIDPLKVKLQKIINNE